MQNYSFSETISYFGERLNVIPPKEDIELGTVELVIDELHAFISKGELEGSLKMEIALGLMLHPLRESRLKELATSNFLGINTGGCTFAFDEAGASLLLRANTSPAASPHECWEWLHRLVHVAREWNHSLEMWEEFVTFSKGKNI